MQVQDNHVFKFIFKSKPEQPLRGVRTFPQHTYGVSNQSPDSFKHKHVLVNPLGYNYKHENNPNFQYHSQQKSHIFDHYRKQNSLELTFGESKIKQNPKDQFQQAKSSNPFKYHLKKGRLTEFHDKNSWMSKVYVMSGNERSHQARQESNKQRQSRISQLKPKSVVEPQIISNLRIKKNNFKTLEDVLSQKTRIKSRRRQQAERQMSIQTAQKSMLNTTYISINEKLNVENNLSKTAQEWFPTSKGKFLRKNSNILVKPLDDLQSTYNLQQWQRKTSQNIWNNRRKDAQNQQEETIHL